MLRPVRNAGFIRQGLPIRVLLPDESGVPVVVSQDAPPRTNLIVWAFSREGTWRNLQRMRKIRPNAPLLWWLAIGPLVQSAQAAAQDGVSFSRDIAPIFAQKCLTCHNAEKAKGKYQLETFERLLQPGSSEEAPIVPGRPDKSRLLNLLRAEDEDDRMPQKAEPLPAAQISLIERWIKEGARFDAEDRSAPLHALIATSHPSAPEAYTHPVPIRALAFNADGSELAVSGYHELTFWRCEDGKLLRRIPNFAQQIYCITTAPEDAAGRDAALRRPSPLIAVACGTPGRLGQVNLLDPTQSSSGRVLGTSRDAMLAACFSPSGERLAVGGADNIIRVYNTASGRQELAIEQHADWILGLAFSPDGKLFASASRDKTSRTFDATSGELENTYVGHNDAIFAVAFSSDGKRVLSAGRDKSLHLWSASEAKKVDEAKGCDDEILRLLVQSNQVFSCSADKKLRLHSIGDKLELVRAFSGHQDVPYSIAYHPGSQKLASGSFDGEVRLWNVSDGKTMLAFKAVPGLGSMRAARSN